MWLQRAHAPRARASPEERCRAVFLIELYGDHAGCTKVLKSLSDRTGGREAIDRGAVTANRRRRSGENEAQQFAFQNDRGGFGNRKYPLPALPISGHKAGLRRGNLQPPFRRLFPDKDGKGAGRR